MAVRFVLNGEPVHVPRADPHVTLLKWLRDSGFTGTKEGCAEGECGACAVAIVRAGPAGESRFEPVNSCLVPLASLEGRQIVTVEGVARASGELHPVQAALVREGGSQCGYCTPGFVVSLFCEYYRAGRDGYDPEAISGNLCRCTGYRPIAAAARSLGPPSPDDPRLIELAARPRALDSHEHASAGRRFVRPARLAELFALLEREPGATLIAGGTDRLAGVNLRGERFPLLVSLEALDELRRVEVTGAEIAIGAGLPLGRLEELLKSGAIPSVALLEQLLPLFSSRLIRNQATLGGNLATASPIGDLAPALLALDAELALVNARGERRVRVADFFTGYRKTALAAGEIILSVRIPRPCPAFQRFYKISKRVLDDISSVAAAYALDLDAAGRVARLAAGFGGIAATPLRAASLELAARGRPWNAETVRALRGELARLGTPLDDHRASAAYRRAMIGNSLEKFWVESRAAGGAP